MNGDLGEQGTLPLFTTSSAQQVAIAVNIQSHLHHHSGDLSSPINKPVLTKDVIPKFSQALSEMSGHAATNPSRLGYLIVLHDGTN